MPKRVFIESSGIFENIGAVTMLINEKSPIFPQALIDSILEMHDKRGSSDVTCPENVELVT
ncbi:hypothetical protein SC206_05670 [Rouxiella sp. T17]|uniref:hypothetical protein n=1 Tax=Rouxiella sp. T17 TaxID=3085684 RepID=UPI002FC82783